TPQETTPIRPAAILHSDLEPALVQSLAQALQAGGYTAQALTPHDLGDLNQRAIDLIERLKACQLLVLDEQIGGRSPFEFILNLKAHGETRDIPLCLLYSVNPDAFAGTAFFTSGVDRLLDKTNPEQIARFANPFCSWREN